MNRIPKKMPFSKLQSHPISVFGINLFNNAYPLAIGAGVGELTISSADWKYPVVIYVAAGIFTQLAIAFLRNYFSERKDLLNAMETMRSNQAQHYQDMLNNERETRRELVRELNEQRELKHAANDFSTRCLIVLGQTSRVFERLKNSEINDEDKSKIERLISDIEMIEHDAEIKWAKNIHVTQG